MDCNIFPAIGKKENVFVFHGITATKHDYTKWGKLMQNKGYTTFVCTADRFDWDKTVKNYDALITSLGKETILIGHSMGGTQSLVVAAKNPLVTKVFSFAPLYDIYIDGVSEKYSKQIKELQTMVKTELPANYLKCDANNVSKYFIGYVPSDNIVPASHPKKAVESLFGCLPSDTYKKNVKVFKKARHFGLMNNKETLKFIEDNL
jgi:esterase/lipase